MSLLLALVIGIPGSIIAGFLVWWVTERRRTKAVDPATVHQIQRALGEVESEVHRIAEYVDGLPTSTNKPVKDLFNKGMKHKKKYELAEAIEQFRRALGSGPAPSEKAALLGLIGNCFCEQGKYVEAEGHYKEAVTAAEDAGDQKALSTEYNNIGEVYRSRGDYDQALEWYHKSLKMNNEEKGNAAGLAATYNNIGSVCNSKGDLDQALKWYHKSLTIAEEIGQNAIIAPTYNNIGLIYHSKGDNDRALQWYRKSLKIAEDIGDRAILAVTCNNIGLVYAAKGDYDQALEFLERSLTILNEIGAGDKAKQVAANIEMVKKAKADKRG